MFNQLFLRLFYRSVLRKYFKIYGGEIRCYVHYFYSLRYIILVSNNVYILIMIVMKRLVKDLSNKTLQYRSNLLTTYRYSKVKVIQITLIILL